MKVYISPLQQSHYLSINSYQNANLFSVYYKTIEGPLGFCEDEKSSIIYKNVVVDTIWYNESKNDFEIMNMKSLLDKPFFRGNGVYMINNKFVEKELEKEKELRLVITKNQLRKRYNKPILEETHSFFTDFYNKIERKYFSSKIEELLHNKVEIVIGHFDSLGNHFIMQKDSAFMNRLLASCSELNVSIYRVSGEEDIPAW